MSDPLWTQSQIEQELAAVALPPRMTVEAARAILYKMQGAYEAERVTLQQEKAAQAQQIAEFQREHTTLWHTIDTQTEYAASLEKQLFRATHPADAYVTVKPETAWTMHLSQHANIVNNKHLWANNATGTSRLVANLPTVANGLCLHMSEGFGVNVAKTHPDQPANWTSLQSQLAFVAKTGLPCMMNLYLPPWWMSANGTTKMIAADAYKHKGRLMTSYIPQWQQLVEEGVTVYARAMLDANPDATLWLDIHNEWKGFYEYRRGDKIVENQRWADGDYPGTPGDVGDMDFPPYAKLTYEAAYRATDRLGIPRERVKVGGSYPVITFQGAHNADSVSSAHELYERPYGTARKAPFNAFERFLNYWRVNNLPLDFLSIDGGTRNRDLSILTDDFSNCVRFREVGELIREIAYIGKAAYGELPIYWKELYAKPQTTANDNPHYRGLVKVRGLLEAARGGADRVYWWGWEGEGDDPPQPSPNGAIFHGVDKPNGGEPTVIADMLREFGEVLPVGATVYELEIEGEGLHGVATDSYWYVLNQTAEAQKVALDERVVEVGAFDKLVVERG